MKKIINTFGRFIYGLALLSGAIAGLIICISMLVSSCNDMRRKTTEVSVLWDVTEKQIASPNSHEILPLFDLNADPLGGADFSFSYMSDVSYNRRTVFSLPKGGREFTTNQFDRKREVQKFEKSVSAFLDSLASDTIGRNHSSVYLAIAEELNRLAKSKKTTDKKLLLVYSDLMENTQSLSFYNKGMISLLHYSPEKISDMLLTQVSLEDLSGIEVHFVFQPKNAQSDDAFRLVSMFYKKLLEDKGATVFISANLNN